MLSFFLPPLLDIIHRKQFRLSPKMTTQRERERAASVITRKTITPMRKWEFSGPQDRPISPVSLCPQFIRYQNFSVHQWDKLYFLSDGAGSHPCLGQFCLEPDCYFWYFWQDFWCDNSGNVPAHLMGHKFCSGASCGRTWCSTKQIKLDIRSHVMLY